MNFALSSVKHINKLMNYQQHYHKLINRAKNRLLEGYVEKHHIIPRCMNGSNDAKNIVVLTAREHFVAHLLLTKIHGGKLWHAAFMMSNMKRYKSRTYEWVKENHALEISRLMKGRRHKEEAKQKMSNSKKGKPSPMLGRKHKEETKQKQSDAKKDKTHEEIYGIEESKRLKENLRKKNKGQVAWNKGLTKETDERIKKQSDTQTGKKLPKSHIENLKKSHKGQALGTKWINNGIINKRISSIELKEYLNSGWKSGVYHFKNRTL